MPLLYTSDLTFFKRSGSKLLISFKNLSGKCLIQRARQKWMLDIVKQNDELFLNVIPLLLIRRRKNDRSFNLVTQIHAFLPSKNTSVTLQDLPSSLFQSFIDELPLLKWIGHCIYSLTLQHHVYHNLPFGSNFLFLRQVPRRLWNFRLRSHFKLSEDGLCMGISWNISS